MHHRIRRVSSLGDQTGQSPSAEVKFGADFARRLRRRRPQPGDTWHLDEVFIRIRGVLHYLWRAVDQNGVVLDLLVQNRRNGAAAKHFFKSLWRQETHVHEVA